MPAMPKGILKTSQATRMATTAPPSPALGASQRLGTSSQKSVTTGKAAKTVDRILLLSGLRSCW